jgi:hypothetical protein
MRVGFAATCELETAGAKVLTRALAADHLLEPHSCRRHRSGPIFTPFHQRRVAAAGETIEQQRSLRQCGKMCLRKQSGPHYARSDHADHLFMFN